MRLVLVMEVLQVGFLSLIKFSYNIGVGVHSGFLKSEALAAGCGFRGGGG